MQNSTYKILAVPFVYIFIERLMKTSKSLKMYDIEVSRRLEQVMRKDLFLQTISDKIFC